MKSEIISIGTELLLGQIVDTNAAYLSARLPESGIYLYHRSTVGDNYERLAVEIKNALSRSDIVFTIGGLGPTEDDITKECIANVLNEELVIHDNTVKKLKDFFAKLKIEMTDNNLKQALVPKNGRILENNNGTAPGCVFFTKDNKFVIIMPGPPREFIPMYENAVLPFLKEIIDYNKILKSRILRVFGLGESAVADQLKDLLNNENPTVAPYVGDGDVTIRISARNDSNGNAEKLIDEMQKKITEILGDYVYSTDNKTLEEVLISICNDKNIKIACAESCTGGLISKRITDIAGVSKIFTGGVVTYSNDLKMKLLEVSNETLVNKGAVSKEVAEEMAIGLKKLSNADISLSVTGIAGPDGGTEDKPVGLVYIAVAYKKYVDVYRFIFNGDRYGVRLRASSNALNIMKKIALEEF